MTKEPRHHYGAKIVSSTSGAEIPGNSLAKKKKKIRIQVYVLKLSRYIFGIQKLTQNGSWT